ncbi:hypothetical protein ANN_02577 [Periplaneta americana]|uniref:Uncharacterized protein n=1 Tax=Periplaneta americana TaxID=6978 RepID=A0ABQ8TWP2_PERAM|nr:hypothetical protein ANN_02577 [Periplaneta americana]
MEGKRPKGRPRQTWKQGIQDTMRERGIEWKEAMVTAQDRERWKALCKTSTPMCNSGTMSNTLRTEVHSLRVTKRPGSDGMTALLMSAPLYIICWTMCHCHTSVTQYMRVGHQMETEGFNPASELESGQDMAVKSDQPGMSVISDQQERSDKSDKSGRSVILDQQGRSDQSDMSVKPDQPGMSIISDQQGGSVRSDQQDRLSSPEKFTERRAQEPNLGPPDLKASILTNRPRRQSTDY